MNVKSTALNVFTIAASASVALFLAGCDKPAAGPGTGAKGDSHTTHDGHDDHDGHDHAHEGGHSHDKDVGLGEAKAGPFTVTASSAGPVKAGEEGHFTIHVTGAEPVAVRAWIGAESGAGSIKSKGETEEHGFHVHADAPDPIPAGAKLWVEVEETGGAVHVASFELK